MDFLEYKDLGEIASEFKERLDIIAKSDNSINGTPSGFAELDAITKGFQPSDLILLGSVAGMGKTSFIASLIRKMAIENQCPIAFFSLEMTRQQLMMRLISHETNISAEQLRLGLLDENEMELVSNITTALEHIPLSVFDYPFLTVSDIEDALLCSPPDFAKVLIIDSLECIAKNKKDKVGKVLNKRELSKITFQLKELAAKLEITIVVSFLIPEQVLGRRYNRRPLLSDIRKYAPIDTYADLVLLLYRPEYYKIEEWDDDAGLPTSGEAEIIIAKNNNGSLDTIRLKFDGSKGLFDNLSYYNKIDDDDLPF